MSGIDGGNNEVYEDISSKKFEKDDVIKDGGVEKWVKNKIKDGKKQEVAKNFHTLLEMEKPDIQFVKENVFDVLNDDELSEVVNNMNDGGWIEGNSEDYADLLINTVNEKGGKKACGALLDKTPYLLNKFKNAFKKGIMRQNLISNAKNSGYDKLLMRSSEMDDEEDIKYIFNNYPKTSRNIVTLMKAFENQRINSVVDVDSISGDIYKDVKDLLSKKKINQDQAMNLSDGCDILIKRIKSEERRQEIKNLKTDVNNIIENPDENLEMALNKIGDS